MMVLEAVGREKSWLVYTLSSPLGESAKWAASMGVVAFLYAGPTCTDFSCFLLVRGRSSTVFPSKALQEKLAGIEYIVIDELFMVSQARFAWVERWLRQAKRDNEPLGGISTIITGDQE